MRADRLVAILLFLQRQGMVTAGQVAQEFEVSERTARRDLEALAASGVPLYSQHGRGGGWTLVGGSRTDLTGLTSIEARTLFLLMGPASAAAPELKTALRKLMEALPEPFQAEAEAAADAVVIDSTGWTSRSEAEPMVHLGALQAAVLDAEQVQLGYRDAQDKTSRRIVHPLGLVTKRGVWYLVADTARGMRTFRVSRVTSVKPRGVAVVRPPDFDLDAHWQRIASDYGSRFDPYRVTLAGQPVSVGVLRRMFGPSVSDGVTRADGSTEFEVGAPNVYVAAAKLAGLGSAVEVIGPEELRDQLRQMGQHLVELYS